LGIRRDSGGKSGQSPIPNPKSRREPSWWVARAREAGVRPGFTKEEILRPAKDDPRAAGGLFERIGGVLSELL